eukprot:440149-Prymnesium_polylepis.1
MPTLRPPLALLSFAGAACATLASRTMSRTSGTTRARWLAAYRDSLNAGSSGHTSGGSARGH